MRLFKLHVLEFLQIINLTNLFYHHRRLMHYLKILRNESIEGYLEIHIGYDIIS